MANLEAHLYQKDKLCIATHFVCGILPDLTALDQSVNTIKLPSPLARRITLEHPSKCRLLKPPQPLPFVKHCLLSVDKAIQHRNKAKFEATSWNDSLPNSIDCGMWIGLPSEERLDESMIPFIADMIVNTPDLLPKHLQPGPRCVFTLI